jgi:hypothetical protein
MRRNKIRNRGGKEMKKNERRNRREGNEEKRKTE